MKLFAERYSILLVLFYRQLAVRNRFKVFLDRFRFLTFHGTPFYLLSVYDGICL